MNATTTEFLTEIDDQINDAIMIGGTRGRNICRQVADDLAARRIAGYLPDGDPADVELTDEQWNKITKNARVQASFCAESW